MLLMRLVVAACLTLSMTSAKMALDQVGPHETDPSYSRTSVEAMWAPIPPAPVPKSESGTEASGGGVPPARGPLDEGEMRPPTPSPSPRIVGTKPKQRRPSADQRRSRESAVDQPIIAVPTDAERVLLTCIRAREQGAAEYATNTGNGFYGAYQFNLGTWKSNGGKGLPHLQSAEVQDSIATVLLRSRGLQPWSAKVEREC
jgi:hypothetical protein